MNNSTIRQVHVILIAFLNLSCGDESKISKNVKGNQHDERWETSHKENYLDFSKFSGEDIAGVVIFQEHLLWEAWNAAKTKFLRGDLSFEIVLGERNTQFELLNIERSDRNSLLIYSVTGGISGTLTISLDNKGDLNEVDFRPGLFGHDSMNTKVKLLEN